MARRAGREIPHESPVFAPKLAAETVQGPDVRSGETILLFNKSVCLSPVLR